VDSPVSVNPFRCRVWGLHDRLDEHITEQNCAEEIASFKAHGQRVRVIGRPVHDEPQYDVEVICGARRLFVARILNVPVLVQLRELSDREAIIEMHIENCLRKDISPYERGRGYLRWLRGGHFGSQEEMAATLKVSPSQVSRLLKLARLPSIVVHAFGDPADICERWGEKLTEILTDPGRSQPTMRAARAIAASSRTMKPQDVYQALLTSAATAEPGSHKVLHVRRDQVIRGRDGSPLFRIRHQQDSIALLLPIDRTSARTLAAIQHAVERILNASEIARPTAGTDSCTLQVATS
jgi:ParB family transcriptional regulator, chromosome partitioning protein